MARPRALLATTTLVVATGLALGTAGTLDLLERPVRDVLPRAWLVPARPETDPDDTAEAGPVPTPGPARTTDTGHAPGPAPAPFVRVASPVLLHVASLGISAPVTHVHSLYDAGTAGLDTAATVGWYVTARRRISPGDPGTAVFVTGVHRRDAATRAPHGLTELAELAELADLTRGERVDVVHLDGSVSTWRVTHVLTSAPDGPASARMPADGDEPRLALIARLAGDPRADEHPVGDLRGDVIVIATPDR